ncbi:TPA: tetratricopeptide repeat protein [Thermoplasmata archaeon]|nr:tetratricopeptide repeat protein [Thermoplasmata archaeon]
MPCLKCEGPCDESTLICDECADTCFGEARFFLSPVLIGPSLYARLRSEGSLACLLGPASERDFVLKSSSDVRRALQDASPEGLSRDDVREFLNMCNETLAHMGVPLKYHPTAVLLTEDAAETTMAVLTLAEAAGATHGDMAVSDLNLRLGVIYWSALNGVLLRTASKGWREERRHQLVSKAKAYFSKVDERDDLFSLASWNLGMLCAEVGDWEEALNHLERTLRHFPNDQMVEETLARADLELGNQIEALTRVDEILAQSPTPGLWLLKGRILLRMGKAEEALECFNQSISADPSSVDAHDLLISTLRSLGKDEEASLAEQQKEVARRPGLEERIFEIVGELTKAPSRPEPSRTRIRQLSRGPGELLEQQAEPISQLDMAVAALEAKDYDTAIQRSRHLVESSPESRDASLLLIRALVSSGNLHEASSRLHSFYEHNRNDPQAWYWRGVIADVEGKWGAAVQYFSKAVTLDPELADAWAAMGDTLLENDKYNGADESYSRALQIDPDNRQAWLGKGKTMRALGRWGAAIQCLDKYNTLVPNDKDAWLLKGDTLFEKEKYRRAIDSYNKFIELYQADSYALGRKGIALNMLGMTDEAVECLEESVRLDSANKEAARWLNTLKEGGSP